MDEIGRLTLTVEQAAEVIGISRSFAYELVQRNELPHRRLGRRIVVPVKALRSFLEGEGAGDDRT